MSRSIKRGRRLRDERKDDVRQSEKAAERRLLVAIRCGEEEPTKAPLSQWSWSYREPQGSLAGRRVTRRHDHTND